MLIGIHGRNDTKWEDPDKWVMNIGKIEAIKLLFETPISVYDAIKQENPNIFFLTRIFPDGLFGVNHRRPKPIDFLENVVPKMEDLYAYGVRYFEIGNEPNAREGWNGWGNTDEDARNYNDWYCIVTGQMQRYFKDIKIGFGGLAVPDAAHRDYTWLALCKDAIENSDFLCCHSYWQTTKNPISQHHKDVYFGENYKYYHKRYPSKEIIISESGDSSIQVAPYDVWRFSYDEQNLANQFYEWATEVQKCDYVKAIFPFLISSDSEEWQWFCWRRRSGELRKIVDACSNMQRG